MFEHAYEARLAEVFIKLIYKNKDNADNLKSIENLSFNISGMLNNSIHVVNWLNIAEVCNERIMALEKNRPGFNVELLNQCSNQLKQFLDINTETGDYNLPLPRKIEIISQFIDFKSLKIVRSTKVSPDKRFTLFVIDNNKFVLDETDYLVDYDDAFDIMKLFEANELHWIKPKKEFNNKNNDYISINNIYYGLAKVG